MAYVYRFIDKEGKVIYYGKTINIDRRIHDHFTKGHLVSTCYKSVCVIEYQKYKTESDALIMETYYITKYDPKFNKQGKSRDIPTLKLEEKEWKVYKTIKPVNTKAEIKINWFELGAYSLLAYTIYKILQLFV